MRAGTGKKGRRAKHSFHLGVDMVMSDCPEKMRLE